VGAAEGAADLGDLVDGDAERGRAALEDVADVRDAPERRHPALLDEALEFRDLVEPAFDQRAPGDGADVLGQGAAQAGKGVVGEELANAAEIEGFERVLVHSFPIAWRAWLCENDRPRR
jgi:hypothetical protein